MSHSKLKTITAAAFVLATFLSGAVIAAPVTNKDIASMLDAKMDEEVVLQLITSGDTKFDTSAGALIKLKEKGASPAILKAMMSPKDKSVAVARPAAAVAKPAAAVVPANGNSFNPEEVILELDGKETQMQYIIPSIRTAARAFGLGGVASYAVLRGDKAARRMAPSSPEFIISVPKNAQAINYLTLANFAVRKNETREVLIGGGYMSYTTGIHRDRIVKVTTEVAADQSRAKEGFVLHRVKPEKPMVAGEYALVLYTGEIRTAGFFAHAGNSYYDFGVD